MNPFLQYISVAIFSIFIGCQITEGALLVPYWLSLSSTNFYSYYNAFGPWIGQFYTVLTIVAALIPIVITVYCKVINSPAFKFALISSVFALLFVSSFYIYFKVANELFYQAALSDAELKKELIIWSYWHWGRIVTECFSLTFLIFSLIELQNTKND